MHMQQRMLMAVLSNTACGPSHGKVCVGVCVNCVWGAVGVCLWQAGCVWQAACVGASGMCVWHAVFCVCVCV